MDLKCPHCGTEELVKQDPEYGWQSVHECIVEWDCVCKNGHDFVISEILRTTSRLVAKDWDEMERLITEEESEKNALLDRKVS